MLTVFQGLKTRRLLNMELLFTPTLTAFELALLQGEVYSAPKALALTLEIGETGGY